MPDALLAITEETLTLLEWPRLCHHLATFTQTPLGAVAAHNILPPPTIAASQTLLAQTQAVEHIENSLEPNWHFKGIADLTEPLERASLGGLISGKELLAIASTLAGVRRLRRVIEEREAAVPSLQALVADVRTFPELEQEIYRCLEEDGTVAERASPKLGEIRLKLKGLREQIQQKLTRMIQRQGNALQETVITQRSDRFVLPVKAACKDQIPGIVHDSSASGNTLYIEPQAIVELGNRLRQSRRQEQTEEERILRHLSDQVVAVLAETEALLAIATQLDLATARCRYSLWLGGNPPRFIAPGSSQPITLRQLRHPLLYWQQQHQDGGSVVPISLTITPPTKVIAITGPNTGGKTVTLKTLGLMALMAKVGLYVPAKDPVEIPWFDQVLADIGDE
ncbi:MAG: Recombination inhibitory protein MutS2, partial [Cyanobacteriota bacterium]